MHKWNWVANPWILLKSARDWRESCWINWGCTKNCESSQWVNLGKLALLEPIDLGVRVKVWALSFGSPLTNSGLSRRYEWCLAEWFLMWCNLRLNHYLRHLRTISCLMQFRRADMWWALKGNIFKQFIDTRCTDKREQRLSRTQFFTSVYPERIDQEYLTVE